MSIFVKNPSKENRPCDPPAMKPQGHQLEKHRKKIKRIQNLLEDLVEWDDRDKDRPTIQEKFLAKEILRIIKEE